MSLFASLYADQLQHWFRVFAPSQFVVIPFDLYLSNNTLVMADLAARLGMHVKPGRAQAGAKALNRRKKPRAAHDVAATASMRPFFVGPNGRLDALLSSNAVHVCPDGQLPHEHGSHFFAY